MILNHAVSTNYWCIALFVMTLRVVRGALGSKLSLLDFHAAGLMQRDSLTEKDDLTGKLSVITGYQSKK